MNMLRSILQRLQGEPILVHSVVAAVLNVLAFAGVAGLPGAGTATDVIMAGVNALLLLSARRAVTPQPKADALASLALVADPPK